MKKKPKKIFFLEITMLIWATSLWAQSVADSTWSMFHHDLHHTGLSPLTEDMDTCYVLWSYTTGDWVEYSPALGDVDGDGNLEVVVSDFYYNVCALNGEDIGVEEHKAPEPEVFFATTNKPNPFAVSTTIEYGLPEDANFNLAICNRLGQKIVTLGDETKKAGYYIVRWDGRNDSDEQVSSSVYLLKFKAGDYSTTEKLLLIR